MMKYLAALMIALTITGCNRTPDTVDGIIAAAKPITMYDSEKAYIASHEVIMGFPVNIEPIVSSKNGKPAGYAAKITELIMKRTGLRVRFVEYQSNAVIVPAFLAKEMDVAMAATDVVERRAVVTVSHPYTIGNGVMLVGEMPMKFPMRVAIGSKYAVQESIAKLASLVTFAPYDNDELGFQALMNKDVGGHITVQPVADFLEKKYNRQFARSPMNFVYAIGYGCQVDQTMVCQILNKGVDSITPEERAVFEKTFFVKPLDKIDPPVKYGTVN